MARTPVTPPLPEFADLVDAPDQSQTRWMLDTPAPEPVTFADGPERELRRTSSDADQLRGKNDLGQVRPADDRFLTDAQVEARDEYVAEETGPEAQQLALRRVEMRNAVEAMPEEVRQLLAADLGAGRGDANLDPEGDVPVDYIVDSLVELPRTEADHHLDMLNVEDPDGDPA